MTVLWVLIGLLVGAAGAVLAYRPVLRRFSLERETWRQEAVQREVQVGTLRDQLSGQAVQLTEAAVRQATLAEKLAARDEALARQKEELTALQERQRVEFKNLAAEILEEKSNQFKQTNRESLELLLKPFRDNIEGFRKKVEEVYEKEAQQRFSLKEEIRHLNEMNLRMSQEANNLTAALKGNSKVQGDWGEMILETILDSSNLIKGVHYQTQENIKDNETGANLRPDVILNLPEGKQIVIDSKVSLTAYVTYSETDAPEAQQRAVKEHVRSVRSHIAELAGKSYQTLLNGQNKSVSPDFVIMFIPNEPAFLLAMQQDSALWSDAYNRKVIISSPTNLFALLKIVDDLWKRDGQSKNALAIATEGANLYDKFVGFSETLLDLGRSLGAATGKYEQAMNQLKTGRGNLIRRAERLRELQVKASKSLPAQLEDYDADGPDGE
ncbi:DNA recombination protein RmuC [Alistipes indistinctus]|uniref:DNA recombination protein RmuC n=1 Tax=Alistipes indistinctus TaxID=626932 RepID=UPI0024312E0F|nr:DNA recombination protein RmuC [Alistipes indistinctus]